MRKNIFHSETRLTWFDITQETDIDIVRIWRQLDQPEKECKGRLQLVRLAIHLLSVTPNIASSERLFSEMGIIHTKLRNRLGHEKVRDTSVLKAALKRVHAEAGQSRRRLKRSFGTGASKEGASIRVGIDYDLETEEEQENGFSDLATDLIEDVADDDDEGGEELPSPVTFDTNPKPIALKNLFTYASSSGSGPHGLEIYWPAAARNLEHEMELYDFIAQGNEH